jgi:chromosome segregation protein
LQFTKLNLTGFKSFVDPTELLIEPGLTGIVGPNGCGKSNLVEALQWVMGEASARRLRGGDMDDVIFGGTTARPARNVATVSISIDNSDRTAPAPLNDSDEIEVERRIDRSKGSTYRVNRREQRARDVQMLFADASSGAQSTALIGQGRIGWLINAKPTERRALLEEAAGISGLHARRHEAELRLSAAETNLIRLQDIADTQSGQIERLKKQARQAERYRRLSEQIRLAEALVLYRHWLDQTGRLKLATERLAAAEARVAETATALETAQQAREIAQQALPPLRAAAIEAAQAAERLTGALHILEAEERRLDHLLRENQQRRLQIDQDLGREKQLATEAEAALSRLKSERDDLAAQQTGETEQEKAATDRVRVAKEEVVKTEAALSAATSQAAAREAEHTALLRRRATIEERRVRLRKLLTEAETKTRELDLVAVSAERLAAAANDVAAGESALATARDMAEHAEAAVKEAQAAEQTARLPVQEVERRAVKLGAESDALKSIVSSGLGKGFAPVLDKIGVQPGLETALGAALGDDLLAAIDAQAAIHWADLPEEAAPAAPLPAGAEPLALSVDAPALLKRRLARIGIVPDVETGQRLQTLLQPGQRLVTRDGAAWRWDGLTVAAGAPTAAATRLAQRNRLKALEAQRAALAAELAEAQAAQRQAAATLGTAQATDRAAHVALQQAAQTIATARQAQSTLVQQHAQTQARHQAATEAKDRLSQELAEADAQATAADQETAALPDPSADRREVERLRGEVGRLRQDESLHQRELDRLLRDASARRNRIGAIEAEATAWRNRAISTVQRCQTLEERRTALQAETTALGDRPTELATERARLQSAIATARDQAASAADALKRAEQIAVEAERAQQNAAALHAGAREDRVRAEAAHEQAKEARDAASARPREAFECPAEHLPRVTGIPVVATDEATQDLETRFDRLKREREAIGPVNLMAETEMAELSSALETIRLESADLVAAIAKLRQAIQQLNKEGRERLVQAFEAVNAHFQELFVRLFGGGHAYLELTQNEADPFAGGLEIMASPPGKKLQMLSLLSGGERALTALALIFAVFLTNPAPISVLDEVDAPLDDANVERFCQLVREIGDRTGTRFLIITHHRVSMARMDRLYGVTMVEKGISRLVSVELAAAEGLRQTA